MNAVFCVRGGDDLVRHVVQPMCQVERGIECLREAIAQREM